MISPPTDGNARVEVKHEQEEEGIVSKHPPHYVSGRINYLFCGLANLEEDGRGGGRPGKGYG